jgi:hypothetical protein
MTVLKALLRLLKKIATFAKAIMAFKSLKLREMKNLDAVAFFKPILNGIID